MTSASNSLPPEDARHGDRFIRPFLLGAMVVGIVARAFIHFGTPLEPRINGAYYFVQVRSILESGHLAVPDLPLIFWIQAAVARLVQLFTGLEQERAIIFACKVVDSIAPALLVVPVHYLLRRWRNAKLNLLAVAAILALAVVHPPFLIMTSDFQKNALGLVWFAVIAVAVRQTLVQPSPRAAIIVLFFLILAGLTHIGVFGAVLLFGALAGVGGLVFLPAQRKWLLGLAIVSICVTTLVLLVTWHGFDSQRSERFVNALLPGKALVANTTPNDSLAKSPQPQTPARSGARRTGVLIPLLCLGVVPVALLHVIAIGALLVLWRERRQLPRGESVFVAAVALTALILAWPFAFSDRAVRFQMLAAGPLVLLTPFVLARWPSRRVSLAVATAILAFMIGSLGFSLGWNIKPTIPEDSYAELKSLRASIADPSRTLIIAPHGLEWWVVWTLRTKFAHSHSVRAGDWHKYSMVAVIRQKRGGGRPGWGRRPDEAQRQPNAATPSDGTKRSFREFAIPADAQILADGATFTLAHLIHPPANLPK